MNRSLKLSIWMALALGSSQVMALDLGQIQVKSALGQPLLAEIPLHPANPAELQNLTVQLASSEDFAHAGITGGRTTIPLHFSVANAGSDHPVIRITSSVAVDDPYLDLLIEVNSHAAGKSVREFAILLDPPGTSSAASTAAAQTRVERRSEPVTPRRPVAATPAAAPKPAHAVSPAPTAATASNGQYGPVAHGQTLSSIARSTAPSGVDVQQMMLALKQANPEAFYRDNINALKSGAVLRVPTSTEAQAMTIAAAVAEVRRQNSDWRAGTPGKPAVVADAATRASASSAPGNVSAGGGDRLALVPAKDVSAAQGGSNAGGKGDKSAASLRQDLLRTQESLASLQQQGADLKTRLKDLTDINTKNEHLLSLKDSEIAELQSKLAAARKAAGLPVTAPASAATIAKPVTSTSVATASSQAKPEAASTAVSPSGAPVAAGSTATAAAPVAAASSAPAHASTTAAVVAAPPKPVVKPAVKHVVPPPSPAPVIEQPWYMQTWAWAAGAGAIVVLLLLALLGRRRKSSAGLAAKSATSLADRFGTAPAGGQGFASGDDVDQEELLDQLAEHPDDIGLHLELVTLYYSRRDVEHFEAAAEAMHAHITDPQQDEWQDVVHMGEDLVPGHPLFDHHPELPGHEETEARRAFDIDDYAADDGAAARASSTPPPLPAQEPKMVSEYSFNFDLTHPAAVNSASHQAAAVAAAVSPASDTNAPEVHEVPAAEATSQWHFDDAANTHHTDGHDSDLGEFTDDPVDTKLDLARAYLDMGDADGARAMLSEVMKEGSQMQQDVAKRLLDNLH
ncbi:FimV/HubP family polar landmark protein [Rhodanobacter sp. C01]|uniref:FimV/HubP family polar landmark protein n=1 Tax=Rhodanobacter sp. C01 TaxID=1945856 RepID=UPI000984A197|nr:FimV/HubP family polar landmark protein [Rhodanobacter sp. C01]OOG47095.1 fimbrial protein FimV [Rhodanobacter sp. C01]